MSEILQSGDKVIPYQPDIIANIFSNFDYRLAGLAEFNRTIGIVGQS